MDLIAQLDEFEKAALQEIAGAVDAQVLEGVRVKFLGARQGKLKELQALLGKAGKQEKPVVGKRFNEVKTRVTDALDERKRSLERPAIVAGALDVTLPGTSVELGRRHPLMQTID